MIIYYQILKSSNCVRVYKSLLSSKEVSEKEFIRKSKIFSEKKVNERFPYPYNKNITMSMHRIKQINNMKLSAVGVKIDEKNGDKIYCIGNCEFVSISAAMAHGEMIYGEKFMKEHINKLNGSKLYYFRETEPVSDSIYLKIFKEYEELLKIHVIKLKKEDKPNIKKH